jgi:glycosyltransferase involved in cell wall biosynthesis
MSVCIYMAVFDDGRFIGQTLESLREQRFSDFVCLIGDDVSTDDTRNIVKEVAAHDKRFILVGNEVNLGGLANESNLVKLARGRFRRKYLFPFSGHDIVSRNILEEAETFLDANEDFSVSTGTMLAFGDDPQRSSEMKEAEYAFFKTRGLQAFFTSASQLVNCTIYNAVFRSTCFFDKNIFPIEEPMRGHDHLVISWMASYGYVHVGRTSAYYRRFFPAATDHRPDMTTRLIGIGKTGEVTQDGLFRAMLRNYLQIFRLRFSESMTGEELGRFELLLFDALYRRFPYNVM